MWGENKLRVKPSIIHKDPRDKIRYTFSRGDVIMTSIYRRNYFLISPSPIKHVSIYYGNNLLSDLKLLKDSYKTDNLYDILPLIKQLNIAENDTLYLRRLNYYINKIDDKTDYILEIGVFGFKIREASSFLKKINEIYIYKLNYDKQFILNFTHSYLVFMASAYSIIRYSATDSKNYCFESIFSLLKALDENYTADTRLQLYYLITGKDHYNSLSIDNSNRFILQFIYRRGSVLFDINN